VRDALTPFTSSPPRSSALTAPVNQAYRGNEGVRVWTVGHSTRGPEEFIALIAAYGIGAVADVRRFPGSRKYPHFSREQLSDSLASASVEYLHVPELGGRRRPRPDSQNNAWRSESFRGYADHMETEEFRAGVERLLELAGRKKAAVMCSEAVWWRCHRALIADFLKVRGVEVEHILSMEKSAAHPYTSAARVVRGRLTYAGDGESGSPAQANK
jgi:uncharacterized protein (DUF488 family)